MLPQPHHLHAAQHFGGGGGVPSHDAHLWFQGQNQAQNQNPSSGTYTGAGVNGGGDGGGSGGDDGGEGGGVDNDATGRCGGGAFVGNELYPSSPWLDHTADAAGSAGVAIAASAASKAADAADAAGAAGAAGAAEAADASAASAAPVIDFEIPSLESPEIREAEDDTFAKLEFLSQGVDPFGSDSMSDGDELRVLLCLTVSENVFDDDHSSMLSRSTDPKRTCYA